MAMYVHNFVWYNKLNRTLIFSILMTLWTFLLEMYLLFWPTDSIKEHILLGILYFDLGDFLPLLDIFHVIVWSLCFFFTWMAYAIVKEITRSEPAGIVEFVVMLLGFAFFVFFIVSAQTTQDIEPWIVTIAFVGVCLAEFGYFYLALAD